MKILLSFLILITLALLNGPVTAAEPAPVSQTTDAITQINMNGMRDGPAMAMGDLYQATSQVSSDAVHRGMISTGRTKAMDKIEKGKAK